MKLDALDQVVRLRNHRTKFQELKRKANGQPLICSVGYSEQDIMDVASHITVTVVRDAIVQECDRCLAENTAELEALGVEIE